MKIFLTTCVFILFWGFSYNVLAADTHHAAALKLLELNGTSKIMEQVREQMDSVMSQQIQQIRISEEKRPIAEKYSKKIVQIIFDEMSWEKAKDDYVELYKSVYTEKEILQLIEFYKSDIGKIFVAKMPILMNKSVKISQKYMQNTMPKIQQTMKEMEYELKK